MKIFSRFDLEKRTSVRVNYSSALLASHAISKSANERILALLSSKNNGIEPLDEKRVT